MTKDKGKVEQQGLPLQACHEEPACSLTYWDLWGSRQGLWVNRRDWLGSNLHMHSDVSSMLQAVHACQPTRHKWKLQATAYSSANKTQDGDANLAAHPYDMCL